MMKWWVIRNPWRILQAWLRRRRFRFVQGLLTTVPRPLQLLDVGGTPEYWGMMGFTESEVTITLYNRDVLSDTPNSMCALVGDARSMHDFQDQQFDVVFSNSVIEHVGSYRQQQLMAQEVQRVGRCYCVQTPSRYFPIEPHVLLPFFQFLPFRLKVFILTHFRSPWGWKLSSHVEAEAYVREIRLLNERELRQLFPGAEVYKEKFLGLTKSFVIYKGF